MKAILKAQMKTILKSYLVVFALGFVYGVVRELCDAWREKEGIQ